MSDSFSRQILSQTQHDSVFDGLTALAAKILGVPVTLISVVEAHRQFFPSQCGLEEPYATSRETPLSHSFCQHVAASAGPLIIEDARAHELVRDNLAIRDLGVIAYLGVPLFDENDAAMGALCAIDGQPRQWTAREVEILTSLAAQVMSELSLRQALGRQAEDLERLRQFERQRAFYNRADRHDLRTPLNALVLGLQAIGMVGPITDDQRTYLEMAERNGRTLVTMIDRMLDIGNVEDRGGAALTRRTVRPGELLAPAAEQVAALLAEKGQTLRLSDETSLAVEVDPEKLTRVLTNLLGNAIKFTAEGGCITLSACDWLTVRGQPAVTFSVEDTGIGMTSGQVASLFTEGYRAAPDAPTSRSTGIGLTFCKRIVEAHDGRIEVQSRPGEGSTFYFTLPAIAPAEGAG